MRSKTDELILDLIEIRQDSDFDSIKPTIRTTIKMLEDYKRKVNDAQSLLRSLAMVLKESD